MPPGVGTWISIVLLSAGLSLSAWAEDSSIDPEHPTSTAPPALLKVANREILEFRATVLGETPEARVLRAKAVINDTLDDADSLSVAIDPIQNSYLVLLGQRRAFIVAPKDIDPMSGSSVQATAEAAAEKMRQVVAETQQGRSLRFMLQAGGISLAATVLYLALLRGLAWLRQKLSSRAPELVNKHARSLRLGQTEVFDGRLLYPLILRLLWLLRWTVILLLTYEWLSFVLSRFPYTRPIGESLNSYLVELVQYLLQGMVGALPGLVVALAIFFIAKGVSSFSRRILTRLARPGTLSWLNSETLQPTTRLTSLAIWLFALAMAYPYLPGAGTEAFKGLSVLLGLMISLGASSVVGQAAAGLILTYTRTLRRGEYVRIGDYEGTVTELGMFTTSIRTGLGEVLTIPNSMITSSVSKNYSRTVQGNGYVVDTVVTIGYDTPWRQVEAMLIEAARRTEGILEQPSPRVFQTALSDFYPEYRLVAQAVPSQPVPRAVLLSMLHANIQDVFNEHQVQIMSPHYRGDPDQEKWVPKDKWYAAPAQPPKEKP